MTHENSPRLTLLLQAALECDPASRIKFVAEECGVDSQLREELMRLIEAEEATKTLRKPFVGKGNFSSGNADRFQPGELIIGRFRIKRLLGRGGMGEVYQAEDLQLGIIAVKTIRDGISSSAGGFERFRQEVQTARKVSGPQVCRIHELFLLPATGGHRSTAFLTMEYLEGVTLSEKLSLGGLLPWKEALPIAVDICEGLRLIHEKGVVHRDLKSSNIMLCQNGKTVRTVLMDFGLAHNITSNVALSDAAPQTDQVGTLAGTIVGTPEYMAPEQFEGKPVSPSTDIYALGIVLYELVTGLHPFAAPTPVAAAVRRAHHPVSVSLIQRSVPRHWDRVIARCLEYEPEMRFQSAQEVAKALQTGPVNLSNLRRDRPRIFWLAVAVLFAMVFDGCFYLWRVRQYYRPGPEAMHWYETGLEALNEGNNVRATRSLQKAIAQDSHFVMAHARLAEAWANLDFDGNAEQELLVATPGERTLKPLDRMYFEAIRASVVKDFPSAVADYRQILDHLPANQRSSGYVDLGVAYERSGDPTHALENYSRASELNKHNPAPLLHSAVLLSREHHVSEAGQAFKAAESLVTTEMNQEGRAELDYQLGYAASDGGNSREAIPILQQSLVASENIHNVQLEIRVLTQLSGATSRLETEQSAKYAERAIQLSRDNQLDSWAADGLVRLASADLLQGKLPEAEELLNEALQVSQQTRQPRVEALANITMASLMNQKGLPDQVIPLAKSALDFFQKNGYFVPAASASLLLIRVQRDEGHYQEALQSGNAFLDLATKSGIGSLMTQANEIIGNVYMEEEEYPAAFAHFQDAWSLADDSLKVYEAVNAADTLWRLGRYDESEKFLNATPPNDRLAIWISEARISSLLSRGRYKQVLFQAGGLLEKFPKMESEDQQQVIMDRTLAEAHLGMKRKTLIDLKNIENDEKARATENPAKDLVVAEANLAVGLPDQAHEKAIVAAKQFAAKGQRDSELRSVCIAALAAKALKSQDEYIALSAKAIDIDSQIQHTWTPQATKTYISRPDLQALMRGISTSPKSVRR
jgi:tetratricopeptide (TPR) repeat protein